MHGPDASGAADDRRRHGAGQLGAQVSIGLILALVVIYLRAMIGRAMVKSRLRVIDGKEAASGR